MFKESDFVAQFAEPVKFRTTPAPAKRDKKPLKPLPPIDTVSQLPRSPGVYIIWNKISFAWYVGSSSNLRYRWSGHQFDLRRRIHSNQRIQRAWDKYGPSSFEVAVLEIVASCDSLFPAEQKWFNRLGVGRNRSCYNMLPAAGSARGHIVSNETRAKISSALVGRRISDAAKIKMRAAKIGMPLSEAHKQKIAESLTGKPCRRPLGIVNHRLRRFSETEVRSMRHMKACGFSYSDLTALFGCTVGPIQRIISREAYREVA